MVWAADCGRLSPVRAVLDLLMALRGSATMALRRVNTTALVAAGSVVALVALAAVTVALLIPGDDGGGPEAGVPVRAGAGGDRTPAPDPTTRRALAEARQAAAAGTTEPDATPGAPGAPGATPSPGTAAPATPGGGTAVPGTVAPGTVPGTLPGTTPGAPGATTTTAPPPAPAGGSDTGLVGQLLDLLGMNP